MEKMIPFYNTENIPGKKYELLGTVKGSMIQSKHLGRDIGNVLKSVVGGELRGYSEMLNEARAIATKRMMQEVPQADVVVTNPTHFSVAIKYDEKGLSAPVVVAKGADELAMHIRKIATANDVPLIPSPMLARAIFYSTEVDDEIPNALFMAVAQVLAHVYQLKAHRAGKGKRPKPLKRDLPIPPEYRR